MPDTPTQAEIVERNGAARASLSTFLDTRPVSVLTGQHDAAGWSVKDHLAHLIAWEQSMVALFAGRARHLGLGVPEALYLARDEDALNAEIQRRWDARSLDDVRRELKRSADEMDAVIARLDDAALNRTYSHYLPDEPGDDDGSSIAWRVVGNTYLHIEEHLAWMRAIAGAD
jgi:hypothetical protein